MKSLDEKILINLKTELNMAIAKRSVNIQSGLPTSMLDARIGLLKERIRQIEIQMIEQAMKK